MQEKIAPKGEASLSAFIDSTPLGRLQITVIVICTIVTLLDGFDAQAIGYIAPALTKALAISRSDLGPIFAAGMTGLMLGALLFGPVADRIGRKFVLMLCVAEFGICTLITAAATDITGFMVLRFLAGLGLGGATPVAVALTSEYCPKRLRATLVIIMYCGFSVGAAAGGYVSSILLLHFNWQYVLCVGGILPIAMLPVLLLVLPESLHFLLVRHADRTKFGAILARLAPGKDIPNLSFEAAEDERVRRIPVIQLFQENRTARTLLLWGMFFLNLVDLFFLFNWLPTVMTDRGIPVHMAAEVSSLMQVGGTLGAIILGRLVDRGVQFRLLSISFLGGAVFISLLGPTHVSLGVTMATVFGVGFCVIGSQTAANAIAALAYPTAIRSTGVSWAIGIGRIGSIVGPIVGGLLLSSLHLPSTTLFLIAAVPALGASLCAFFFSRVVRNAARDDVVIEVAEATA